MKKTLIALATLAAAGTAFAQSSVTLSGSIQTGVIDTGAATAQRTVGSFGSGANAINFASTEDLGGGLRGGFSGQIRFSAATGDATSAASFSSSTSAPAAGHTTHAYGGALFHTANAFVSGGFGTVRVGKIAEASTCAFDPWGCGGGAALQAGGVTTGAPGSTGGALIGAAAVSNAFAYTTPTINGFSAGYQTSLSAKAGQSQGRTNERETFNISYANGPLNLAYISIKGGVNAGSASAPVADDASEHTAIAGSYNFGIATVSLVKGESKGNTTATNNKDITSLGLTVPMGAYTVLAGYNKDKKMAANADTQISAGVNYALSKRTTLGADLFKVEAHAGTGFVARVRHNF